MKIINFKEWLINEETHKFSSTQINFKKASIEKISNWSKKNISKEKLFEEENDNDICDHVTVLYGLHTNNPKEIKEIVSKFPKFKIKLGKISKFEIEKCDVIKIEISGSKLFELNKKLSKLEHTDKFPDYKPHCTIAYVKKGSCDNLIGNTYFKNMEINVDSIIFSSKERVKSEINLI